MRRLALLLTLTGFVLPAFGAKRVTVDQLEQTLLAAHTLQDADPRSSRRRDSHSARPGPGHAAQDIGSDRRLRHANASPVA